MEQDTGSGVRGIENTYRAGKENSNVDVHSCDTDISALLQSPPAQTVGGQSREYSNEQDRDPELLAMKVFLNTGVLPGDTQQARKIVAQAQLFTLINKILHSLDSKNVSRTFTPICILSSLRRTTVAHLLAPLQERRS